MVCVVHCDPLTYNTESHSNTPNNTQVQEQEKRRGEISLEPDMIPSIIGKGGSNIRELQKKFNLRIDVNKDNGLVSFQGPEDMIETALSHFRDLKLKFEEEKQRKRRELEESKRHEKQQHQDAKDSETSSTNDNVTPVPAATSNAPPGFADIPIGMSGGNGDMYLSKNAKRRLRRNRRRKEEAPSPMELLMGSDSSSSKRTTRSTKRTSSSNKPEALTDAMRLLGLGTSTGISPSHPLEAEEESIDIRDDTGDDADGVESSYYSSSSGYKLRL